MRQAFATDLLRGSVYVAAPEVRGGPVFKLARQLGAIVVLPPPCSPTIIMTVGVISELMGALLPPKSTTTRRARS